METKQDTKQAAEQICDAFNARHKVGTDVEYDIGTLVKTTTRSAAWPLSRIPTILLHNVMGPVPLEYIKVVEPIDH